MDRIDTVAVPKTLPRPADEADVQAVLNAICSRRPRCAIAEREIGPVEVLHSYDGPA
jgi:hypothetical protein